MTEKIFVSEDGVQREATSEELQQLELDKIERVSIQESLDAKIAARQSGVAKLAALGLTEEEIAAL
jgi:DNA-binding NarL/FixJ family response regulator